MFYIVFIVVLLILDPKFKMFAN